MFNYTAGIHSKDGYDIKNFEKITGYSIRTDCKAWKYDFPQIEIAEKLVHDDKIILNVKPYMHRGEIREIERKAGCHIYTDCDGVVLYGDNRFLGVFASESKTIPLSFPKKVSLYDAISKKEYDCTDNISLDLTENKSAFLVVK